MLLPCLLHGGGLVVRQGAELSTAQDMELFILEVLRHLAVPGRKQEQPQPMTGWAGWGEGQLTELMLCLSLISPSKGFLAFLFLQENSSTRQRPKTVGLQAPALREQGKACKSGK